jgi:hypothetical protein
MDVDNMRLARGVSLLTLLACLSAILETRAQAESQKWVAASRTAYVDTGDIEFSDANLRLVGINYPLRFVRDIDPGLFGDIGKIIAMKQPIAATLYRVKIPASTKLLSQNLICGQVKIDANWLLKVPGGHRPYVAKPRLTLLFFSGASEPDLHYEVQATTRSRCFGYNYTWP